MPKDGLLSTICECYEAVLWCTEKLTVGLVQISFISQPLSHSDPLRIIEECLSADLTKYTTERSAAFIWGGYLFAS